MGLLSLKFGFYDILMLRKFDGLCSILVIIGLWGSFIKVKR